VQSRFPMIHHPPKLLRGLSDIASRYDCAICDVWGVLHNGREFHPSAIDAMRKFRESRGPVILLSNAPRPPDGVIAQFDRLSMPHDFYNAIVTSGGEARAELARRTANGKTLALFYLGPSRDNPLFDGLNVRLTREHDAHAVLCTGPFNDETETPEDYRAMLQRFLSRKLPFLCANPDIVVQRGDKLVYCAGAIARLYESMDGPTVYYGKPYAPVFEAALKEARDRGAGKHPLVIGDGLETDILGANGQGLDSLFIAGGIHGAELGRGTAAIAELFREKGVSATHLMPALSW
jgi:HAD superfamily hydrolase (TIGR01459 family)